MGFDLYGVRNGVFSCNVHNFRPLWLLVSNICNFTNEQFERGCFNEYDQFSKIECDHIIACLDVYLKENIGPDPNHHLLMFYCFVKDSDGFAIG